MSKRYRGWSDSQANAEALARRSAPYTEAHQGSMTFAWDWQKREPANLRDAVRACRRAYADEVPYRLTEGPDSIGDDGTPRFSSQAESYIFGSPTRTDAGFVAGCSCGHGTGNANHHAEDCPSNPRNRPLVSFYVSPFRATLANMERGPEPEAKRAAIVRHVTIGSQGPQEAAIAEGVPAWCAKTIAEDALRSFLRRLTDIRVDAPRETAA